MAANMSWTSDPDCPLLYVLRDNLSMNNPRFGCGLGQCGACTVLMDNRAVRSCPLPVSRALQARRSSRSKGWARRQPHPVQTAFIEEQAFQCGYCLNGWVLTTKALLDKNPHPTDAEMRKRVRKLGVPLRQPHADIRRRAPRRGRNERERIAMAPENCHCREESSSRTPADC